MSNRDIYNFLVGVVTGAVGMLFAVVAAIIMVAASRAQ
jgi:hypothetical protein